MKIRTFLKRYFMDILTENWLFRIFGKTGPRIRIFFSLKPSPDQYGANKKRFSQIGPAVPELLRHTQTDRQAKPLLLCSIDCSIRFQVSKMLNKPIYGPVI